MPKGANEFSSKARTSDGCVQRHAHTQDSNPLTHDPFPRPSSSPTACRRPRSPSSPRPLPPPCASSSCSSLNASAPKMPSSQAQPIPHTTRVCHHPRSMSTSRRTRLTAPPPTRRARRPRSTREKAKARRRSSSKAGSMGAHARDRSSSGRQRGTPTCSSKICASSSQARSKVARTANRASCAGRA